MFNYVFFGSLDTISVCSNPVGIFKVYHVLIILLTTVIPTTIIAFDLQGLFCTLCRACFWVFDNWRAPWSEAYCMYLFCCDFLSCSESTEIWHADLFVLKMSLWFVCFFLSRRQKNMDRIARHPPFPTPPPTLCPSPDNTGFWNLRGKTPCVFVVCYWRRGGGEGWGEVGVDFKNMFEALFSRLWREKGYLSPQKESACQISEQLEKFQGNRYVQLPFMEPFNYVCLLKTRWLVVHWSTLKSLPVSSQRLP